LTGCWAALKEHKFTSTGFRATVIKLLIYMVLIALFHSLERIVSLISYLQLDMLVAGYLACTEIISILENITRISHIKLPNWIMKKLRSFQETGKIETTEHVESSVDGGPITTTDTTSTTHTVTENTSNEST
jgi:phage-related holin